LGLTWGHRKARLANDKTAESKKQRAASAAFIGIYENMRFISSLPLIFFHLLFLRPAAFKAVILVSTAMTVSRYGEY